MPTCNITFGGRVGETLSGTPDVPGYLGELSFTGFEVGKGTSEYQKFGRDGNTKQCGKSGRN